MKDVLRAALACPPLKIADTDYNKKQILAKIRKAKEQGARLVLFPELALTGASCGDLFLNDLLKDRVKATLLELAHEMPGDILAVVGAPLEIGDMIYDAALFFADKKILGAVPKCHLDIPAFTSTASIT